MEREIGSLYLVKKEVEALKAAAEYVYEVDSVDEMARGGRELAAIVEFIICTKQVTDD